MKHYYQKSSFFDKYFEPTRGKSLTGNVGFRFTLQKREDNSASLQKAEVLQRKEIIKKIDCFNLDMQTNCQECKKTLHVGQHKFTDGMYEVHYCKNCGYRKEV